MAEKKTDKNIVVEETAEGADDVAAEAVTAEDAGAGDDAAATADDEYGLVCTECGSFFNSRVVDVTKMACPLCGAKTTEGWKSDRKHIVNTTLKGLSPYKG